MSNFRRDKSALRRRRSALLILLAATTAGLLTSCAAAASEPTSGGVVEVTIATSNTTDSDLVDDAVSKVAEKNGVKITWKVFSDWVLPNQALLNKEVDANAFQSLAFLAAFNVANDADITPVGSTVLSTAGVYSQKYHSLEDLPDGASFAIPNDASNSGRALFILQNAGLLTLDAHAGTYPTVDDISGNPKHLTFTEIAAQQLPNALLDVDAVVAGTQLMDQALSITRDQALFLEDTNADSSRPYLQVVAVRPEDKDDPIYLKLASFWQDPSVQAAEDEASKGNTFIVDKPLAGLKDTLAQLQKDAAAASK